MTHSYYSQRTGSNPHLKGLPFPDILALFLRVFTKLSADGYFQEAFGFHCIDAGDIEGTVGDVPLEILLAVRKKELWPVRSHAPHYEEDDLFDMIEFLYQHVSKPVDGTMHSFGGCGMHWETFNQVEGRADFRVKINEVLNHYEKGFELSAAGEVLRKAQAGFEPIFEADVPTKDMNVAGRVNSAVLRYRRHGASLDDRRQAVRDLVDVLEYLRPQFKSLLTSADEGDLFNIANNFGVRLQDFLCWGPPSFLG